MKSVLNSMVPEHGMDHIVQNFLQKISSTTFSPRVVRKLQQPTCESNI